MRAINLLIAAPLIVSALSSCALWDAYNMAGFDNNEYAIINTIKTQAQVNQEYCNNQMYIENVVRDINFKARELRNYSEFIPYNKDTAAATDKLYTLTAAMADFYKSNEKVSAVYCKLKLQQIASNADTIQQVIGKKKK